MKVQIEESVLQGEPQDWLIQRVANVYEGDVCYRVYAPAKAKGDALQWVDYFTVRTISVDAQGEINVRAPLAKLVVQQVKEHLEKQKLCTEQNMPTIPQKLYDLIEYGHKANDWPSYTEWNLRTRSFLQTVFPNEAVNFGTIRDELSNLNSWPLARASQIGLLEGLAAKTEDADGALAALAGSPVASGAAVSLQTKKVFIVHGHDDQAKETVARFLERLKLEPIILHEQANEGRTVIEKFEVYADVGFAVVLLTPDDVGAPVSERETLKPRARQNVVLELGYFLGKLKRNRVCALYKKGVEIPSDMSGVLYVELDSAGGWTIKLAQELSAAGIPINLEALLKKS
jgi:predicted nucleotide-binding protein